MLAPGCGVRQPCARDRARLMLVNDFFQTTAEAETRGDLIGAFQHAMESLDFDKIHYFSYPNPMTRGPSNDVTIYTNFPSDWFAHYDAEKYEEIDPMGDWAVQTRLPFEWYSLAEAMDLSRRQKRMLAELREAALWDGVTVPIHGPFGQVNGVCFARNAPKGVSTSDLHIGRVLSVQFHQAYTALDDASDSIETALTPRERDVLLRLAEGLNNSDAAERLGISEHSVKFHVQNVSKKLGVNSRVAAVVKAIRLGLIVP